MTRTVEIPLPRGHVALVDSADFDLVGHDIWYVRVHRNTKSIYAVRGKRIDGKRFHFLMHRLIIKAPDGIEVDHINGNGLDNRRENLRFCSRQENNRNQHSAFGAVPFKGVQKRVKNGSVRYCAVITIARRRIYLGYSKTPEDAARAYDAAATEYFGEFAFTNHAMGLL